MKFSCIDFINSEQLGQFRNNLQFFYELHLLAFWYNIVMIHTQAYGNGPSHIPVQRLALGWLKRVHRFASHRGARTYWHSHKEDQLLCNLFGEFAYEFNDRPQVLLSAGQCIVIPANTPHRLIKMQDAVGKRVELLLSKPRESDRANSLDVVPAHVVGALIKSMTANPCRVVPCRRELFTLFTEMYELADRGNSLTDEEVALARVIASMILLKFPYQDRSQGRKSVHEHTVKADVADKILAFIEEHYKERLSVSRLCAYGGYSRSATIGMIREITGKTPGELIAGRRLAEAARLLANTDRTVSDIARECGYTSARYFNYVFRQAHGLTPSSWRLRPATARDA